MASGGSASTKATLATTRAPGEEAARAALEPLKWGEAPQVIVAGDTGTGKTTLLLQMVPIVLEMCPSALVVVIDDKGPRTRYVGQERVNVAHLRTQKLDPKGPHVVIFRGDVLKRISAGREDCYRYAWDVAVRGRRTIVFCDETKHREVFINRQWRKGVECMPFAFSKGREVGLGNVSGLQGHDDLPDEPIDNCTTVLHFKADGDGLAKLKTNKLLRGGVEPVIPSLHGMEVEPRMRGDFVRLVRGRDWDRKIYKFVGAR